MAEIIDFSKVKSGTKPETSKPDENTEAQKLNIDAGALLLALQKFKRQYEKIYRINNRDWAALFQLQTAMHTMALSDDMFAFPEEAKNEMSKAMSNSVDAVLRNQKVQSYL